MDDVPAQEVRVLVDRRPGVRGTDVASANSGAMAANIVGLGLLVAGIIFMIVGGIVGWIIGVICLIGGVGALFLTWQRNKRAAA